MERGIFSFMNTEYDKPFKTYDEMLSLMEKRNIIINDKEFAKNALSNLSYYSLINGYKNTFLQVKGTDDFIEGTKFEELYTINQLDVSLNNIIFKYILYLERSLKSKVSYIVSQSFGVYTDKNDISCTDSNDYLYYKNYSSSTGKRIDIVKKLKNCIIENHHNNIIEHYINTKNHIPPWILTYNIPFGLTIEWYSILKNAEKSYVCSAFISSETLSMDERKEFLRQALLLAREYRNKIAHGNRTFNISGLPVLPKNQLLELSHYAVSSEEYNNGLAQCDLLSILLLLVILLNDKYLCANLLSDLTSLFAPYEQHLFNNKNIYEIFNLPNDVLIRVKNLIDNIYNMPLEEALSQSNT